VQHTKYRVMAIGLTKYSDLATTW